MYVWLNHSISIQFYWFKICQFVNLQKLAQLNWFSLVSLKRRRKEAPKINLFGRRTFYIIFPWKCELQIMQYKNIFLGPRFKAFQTLAECFLDRLHFHKDIKMVSVLICSLKHCDFLFSGTCRALHILNQLSTGYNFSPLNWRMFRIYDQHVLSPQKNKFGTLFLPSNWPFCTISIKKCGKSHRFECFFHLLLLLWANIGKIRWWLV